MKLLLGLLAGYIGYIILIGGTLAGIVVAVYAVVQGERIKRNRKRGD